MKPSRIITLLMLVIAFTAWAIPVEAVWKQLECTGNARTARDDDTGIILTVELPANWVHREYGQGFVFDRKASRVVFGYVHSWKTRHSTTRAAVEEEFGVSLSELKGYDMKILDLPAVLVYTHDQDIEISGRPQTIAHYFVVVRGNVLIEITFICPTNEWRRPGIIDEVDSIIGRLLLR